MRRITIINQKGGVGKTTTTANLGAAAARGGRRVLLIDLDPQAHLSLHFGVEVGDDEPSMYDVLTSATPVTEVGREVRDNIVLLPADIDLAGVEAELISVPGREVILREALESIDGGFDFVLVDCPPSLGTLTINALAACDEVLIPLQAQFFALQGLSKLLNTVTLVRQRINPKLTVSGIALCMHDATTRLSTEVVEDLESFLEGSRGTASPWAEARICRTRIRRNIRLAESASFGKTVFDYDPRSNGAIDYGRLAAEVFNMEPPAEQPRRSAARGGRRTGTKRTDGDTRTRKRGGSQQRSGSAATSVEATEQRHRGAGPSQEAGPEPPDKPIPEAITSQEASDPLGPDKQTGGQPSSDCENSPAQR